MDNCSCLVTGATGCIGAWAVRNLIFNDIPVFVLDFGDSRHRLELIMTEKEISRINFINGDVSNLEQVEQALKKSQAKYIIHLAALQLPFCKKNPPLGARVNVEGTVNIFEAAKRNDVRRIVYASSTAVYGYEKEYSEKPINSHSLLKPKSLYGTYKQANENTAQIYWMENGISSIGLRPHVVYGPGRDQGMTSTPTQAMMAAVTGQEYRITFGGSFAFQFVDDVAKVFVKCLSIDHDGTDVYNIGGACPSISEIISAIELSVPEMKGKITFEDTNLPFPGEYNNDRLASLLGNIQMKSLEQGVSETISTFKKALADGRLKLS